jgi:hypothetical protein
MSYHEAWVKFGGNIKFPHDVDAFEGFLIATFVIDQVGLFFRRISPQKQKVVTGGRDLRPGLAITLKGNLPSMHPAFRYCLRFKHKQGTAGDEYEILPRAGLRNSQRLPWTVATLTWSLLYELETELPSAVRDIVRQVTPAGAGDHHVITEDEIKTLPQYAQLEKKSDYYRLRSILSVRKAWPSGIKEIREMEIAKLEALSAHLSRSPHELCFYSHSKDYGLGEMSFPVLLELLDEARVSGLATTITTKPIDISAACFYGHLKVTTHHQSFSLTHLAQELRNRFGHTIFTRKSAVDEFRRKHATDKYGAAAIAAVFSLVRGGHLLFLDKTAVAVTEESRWFDADGEETLMYLQFPRDDLLKERILGHLRRIYKNFVAAKGKFTLRHPDTMVPSVPGGPLNDKQRMAMEHILNNPITIIQVSARCFYLSI